MKLYEYVLKLKDQASAGLKSFMATAGSAGNEAVRNARKLAGMNREAQALGNTFSGLKKTLATTFLGLSLVGLGTQIFTLGARAEQTKIAFDTMLGSVEKRKALRAELQRFADVSPFSTSQTYDAGESLLAFGVKAKDLLPIMGRLGDISKGNGDKFNRMVDNYGKAVSAQRANTIDLNQFAIAGVPIWDALSKIIGKQGTDLRKYVEQNGVSLPILNKAFENLTNKGGMFFNMMKTQSQSTQGLWSTFTSALANRAVALFNEFQPLINSVLVFGTVLVNNGQLLKDVGYWVGVGVLAFAAYRTVIFSVAAAQFLMNKALLLQRLYLVFAARGWAGLNMVMKMNPVGLVIAGILALAAAVVFAWNKFEGFRGAVVGIWEAIKQLGTNLIQNFLPIFRYVGEVIDKIKKGDFAGAAKSAAKAVAGMVIAPAVAIKDLVTGKAFAGVGAAYRRGDAAGRKMGGIAVPSALTDAFGGGETSSETVKPAGMGDITGGGSKPLTVNINFRNFIENSSISAASVSEGINDLEAKLMDAFGRIIDGGVSSVGR